MSRHDGYDERFSELSSLSYQVAFRLTGDRAESEDVAQEALTRAYLKWHRVSGYAEAWVVRVSTNLVIGGWRRVGARRARASLPEATAEDADTTDRASLVAALRDLPRRQREVAVLRYLGDLSVQQTAAALGLSESAVKAHAARSLVALRRAVGEPNAVDPPSEGPHDPTDPAQDDLNPADPALPRGDR